MDNTPTKALSDVECFDGAHDALNRMKRAYDRGTGCRLTSAMIESLSLTFLGGTWEQDDPRAEFLKRIAKDMPDD